MRSAGPVSPLRAEEGQKDGGLGGRRPIAKEFVSASHFSQAPSFPCGNRPLVFLPKEGNDLSSKRQRKRQ